MLFDVSLQMLNMFQLLINNINRTTTRCVNINSASLMLIGPLNQPTNQTLRLLTNKVLRYT